jgi:hypothetical protein
LLGAETEALGVLEAANARRLDELRVQRYQAFFNPLRGLPRYEALWQEFDRR